MHIKGWRGWGEGKQPRALRPILLIGRRHGAKYKDPLPLTSQLPQLREDESYRQIIYEQFGLIKNFKKNGTILDNAGKPSFMKKGI